MTTPAEPQRRPGEVLLVDLEPVRGTEQNGRPAIVVSNDDMHLLARRVISCPIARNRDPRPTKVLLPAGLSVDGAILVDQVRSIDRDARILRFLGFVPDSVLMEVRGRLATHLGILPNSGVTP